MRFRSTEHANAAAMKKRANRLFRSWVRLKLFVRHDMEHVLQMRFHAVHLGDHLDQSLFQIEIGFEFSRLMFFRRIWERMELLPQRRLVRFQRLQRCGDMLRIRQLVFNLDRLDDARRFVQSVAQWRWDIIICTDDPQDRRRRAAKVFELRCACCSFANLLHSGHQQSDQNRDDGDDNEQLDQRESASCHDGSAGGARSTGS